MTGVSEAVRQRGVALAPRARPDGTRSEVWWVPSNTTDRTYRVQVSFAEDGTTVDWIDCSCDYATLRPNGGKAVCSHHVAVLTRLKQPFEVAMQASP